eukprot:332506-Rhodomonas_salina.1
MREPESLNDLHKLDLASVMWTDLSGRVQGTVPAATRCMGMTVEGGRFYLCSGISFSGTSF